ncbi:MAG: restriction endonuclease [Clostridia bacterium]|nr:restriction endonuclease [Clostridia bacterium]
MENLGWGLPRNRWSLYRFIKEIKTGDSILVPYGKNFNVFEIVDDIIYSNETIDTSIYIDWNNNRATLKEGCFYNKENNLIDMGFYRKVKIIEKEIPKNVYANQDLYSRMKIRLTNANISDIKDSIIQAIVRFRENKPINLKEQIIEESAKKILKLINENVNDIKFEKLIEYYLKSIGATEIITPNKNESLTEKGDADKVAYFENLKTAIIVQAKKHNRTTNEWAVQQIKNFKRNHSYDDYNTQMWVISSCEQFSEQAIKEAMNSVRLINGIEFCKMILDAGLVHIKL